MKKKYFCVALLFLFFASNSKAQHGHTGMSSDKASVHGMVIFGTEKIYASHLPLFHTPHNYQIILLLELDEIDKQKFVVDQQKHPEFATYTIEPERFILPDKIQDKGSFKANLYRGHFERGGVKIADSINIKILEVLLFKKFEEGEKKVNSANYFLFGNEKEQFAIHQISNKPDFDHIIQVKTKLGSNNFDTVILSKFNNPVGVSGNSISLNPNGENVELILLKQLYLEFDDLRE